MKHISYLLLLICLLSSCFDKIDRRNIKIVNKSDKIIYCLSGFEDSIPGYYLGSTYENFEKKYKIEINDYGFIHEKVSNWNDYIKGYGYLRIFILTQDTIDKYSLKETIRNNKYSKLYRLTIEDLDKGNWQIIYNGK